MSESGDGEDVLEVGFHAAADHLEQLVSADPAAVHDSIKLQLYGLYKQATAGKCTAPKPPFWNRAARLKWNHWQQLGAMSEQAAMRQYVETLTNVDPGWQEAAAAASNGGPRQKQGGAGGPVFSTLRSPDTDQQQQASSSSGSSLREAAAQGRTSEMRELLDSGVAVDSSDEHGCTALHFAADRDQTAALRMLAGAGADLNAADDEGQTPLHYAAICGHELCCQLLLQLGADASIKDADGHTALQLGPSSWHFGNEQQA